MANITIIGTGKAATFMGKLCVKNGHNILEVVGRNKEETEKLAKLLKAVALVDVKDMKKVNDLFLLAVSDDSVESVSQSIGKVVGIAIHVSGKLDSSLLESMSHTCGVIWPIKMIKNKFEFEDNGQIPLVINGISIDTTNDIQRFALSLSQNVIVSTDDIRLKMHLAAVILSNFTNHLFSLAYRYCKGEGIDFHVFLPIINQICKIDGDYDPSIGQTGPAIRGDIGTMERHLKLLMENEDLKSIYLLLSSSISKESKK